MAAYCVVVKGAFPGIYTHRLEEEILRTRLWLVNQYLYSPKLCEEDIHQSIANKQKKISKCQKNRVIGSFLYKQKNYIFFSLETLLI